MTGVLMRSRKCQMEIETKRGEGRVTTEVELEMLQEQAKEC